MNKKLLLFLVPVIVLLVVLIAALGIVSMESDSTRVYLQQIELADKYLANNDYENAIVYYTKAIEADKTQEKPYISLAEIYVSQNKYDMAIQLLRNGSLATNSAKIQNMLLTYLDTYGEKDDLQTDEIKGQDTEKGFEINKDIVRVFADYTYKDYTQNYTILKESFIDKKYTVRFQNMDVDFTYYNTIDNNSIVNEMTGKPNPTSLPCEIQFDNIGDLIAGAVEGVPFELIKNSSAYNVNRKYDSSLKKNIVSFSYNNCTFSVECDENGNIVGGNVYNRITPPLNPAANNEIAVNGRVLSVVSAQPVNNAEVKFRSGKNNKTGSVSKEVKCSDGTYSVSLTSGDYTVEVSAVGYNTEYFELNLNDSNRNVLQDFSISPTLASGEVRIVLEWSDTPNDLDSHLTGTTSGGTAVHLYFMNKSVFEQSKEIARLDVDDTDGNGPETTTIFNTNGRFEFKVHRFSSNGSLSTSGAVVKIYTQNSSQPTIIGVPSDLNSEWWDVCTIEDGQIKNINGRTG